MIQRQDQQQQLLDDDTVELDDIAATFHNHFLKYI